MGAQRKGPASAQTSLIAQILHRTDPLGGKCGYATGLVVAVLVQPVREVLEGKGERHERALQESLRGFPPERGLAYARSSGDVLIPVRKGVPR